MSIHSTFKLKDDSGQIRINRNEVEEIVPDADFRFSLIILKTGEKYFVSATKAEVTERLQASGQH